MRVERFPTARAFLQAVEPWLLEHEAENGLILGIVNAAAGWPDGGASAYLAAVFDENTPVLVAFRTVPGKLAVSRADVAGAITLLAQDVADVCPDVETIGGPEPTSAAFASAVARLWGGHASLGKAMRIHQLSEVQRPVPPPSGQLRKAEAADLVTVISWIQGFLRDIHEPGNGIRQATDRIAAGEIYLWDSGGPTSMAASTRKTANGIGVNLVYTPPEHRRRGFATAAVTELSARLLAQGNRFCFLYTDLANPTSNAIYSRIGYVPVCDAGLYFLKRNAN